MKKTIFLRTEALTVLCTAFLAAGLMIPSTTFAGCDVQDTVTSGRQAAVQKAFDKANAANDVMSGNAGDSPDSDYKTAGDARTGAQNCLFDAGSAMGNYVKGASFSAVSSILQKLGSTLSSSQCVGQALQSGKDAVVGKVENTVKDKVSSAVGAAGGGNYLSSIDSAVGSSMGSIGSSGSGFPSMNDIGSSVGQAAENGAQNAANTAASEAKSAASGAVNSATGSSGGAWSQLSSLLGN